MNQTLDTKLNFGKFFDKTLEEVLEIEPSYINWCARNVKEFYIENKEYGKIRTIFPNFYFTNDESEKMNYWILAHLDSIQDLLEDEDSYDDEDYDSDYGDDYDDDCNNNNSYKTDWSNYNDDLDWDQQSMEFWDQF